MRTEDGDLIRQCLNGDSSAFGFLVNKYKEPVYASAYAKVSNFADAQDLTQEVFIKAYQNLGHLRYYDRFGAWLYTITSNLAKNFLRSKVRRPDREYVEAVEQEVIDRPAVEIYYQKKAKEPLYEALEVLPEIYRQVLSLYYLAGMNSKEISQFLGTSTETINMRLSRARKKLKEEMTATMSTTFDKIKLQPSFTFRIVERIKQIKIQPRATGIPLGLSVAGGLIVALLSLTVSFSPLFPLGRLVGSALPAKTHAAEIGLIPVDVMEITELTIFSSEKGDRDFGQKPRQQINQINGSIREKEEKKLSGKKILEGIKPTPGDSTFIGTLHPTLKAAGEDWSIPRLSGTFGHAFSFSMNIGGGAVWQQANIDWWMLWDMIGYVGYEFREFQAVLQGKQPPPTATELQNLKDQTWEAVKASIDQGIPAIAWQPMTVEQRDSGVRAYGWALLVGYDETEKTYTVRHQHYTTEYTVPYDQFGFTDPVNWYCVMILAEQKPFDRMALEVKSLKHAVAFAHGTRFDLKKAPYAVDAVGFAAYELWNQALESGEADVGFTEHAAWILWEMRENAAAYLREIADDFPEVSSRALSDAAVFYDEEIKAIVKLVNICKEHKSFTTPTRQEAVDALKGFTTLKRQRAVEALDAALDAEKKAIGKIEEALAALPTESR